MHRMLKCKHGCQCECSSDVTCRDSRAQGGVFGKLLVTHLQLPGKEQGGDFCHLPKLGVVLCSITCSAAHTSQQDRDEAQESGCSVRILCKTACVLQVSRALGCADASCITWLCRGAWPQAEGSKEPGLWPNYIRARCTTQLVMRLQAAMLPRCLSTRVLHAAM